MRGAGRNMGEREGGQQKLKGGDWGGVLEALEGWESQVRPSGLGPAPV